MTHGKYIIQKSKAFLSSLWENKEEQDASAKNALEPGDIIGVSRYGGTYEHYAVYIGNDRVIHYAGEGGDFSDNTYSLANNEYKGASTSAVD